MHFGSLHVRKRFLGSLLSVGLVATSNGAAIADYLVELPALAFAQGVEPAPLLVPDDTERFKSAWEAHRAEQARLAQTWSGEDGTEVTADQLERYLQRKGSPLAAHAQDFIEAGREHGVDPRVVVAIAGIESSFGKRQLGNNAWGWSGGPGGSLSRWPTWTAAIHEYTERLGALYDTTNVDEAFARRYVPPNWRHWLSTVHTFLAEMDAA